MIVAPPSHCVLQPFAAARSNGNFRSRMPVAAKMALATAGPIGGTPGSPMPPTPPRYRIFTYILLLSEDVDVGRQC